MKKENKKKIIIPAAVLLSIGLFSRCSFLDGTDKTKDKKIDNKPSVVSDKLSSNLDYNSVEDSNINSNEKKNEDKKDGKEDNKKAKEAENKDNKTVDSIVNENKKVAKANSNNGTVSSIVKTGKTGNSGNNYYKPSKPANPSKPVTPNKPSKPVNPSNPSQGGTEKPAEPEKPAKPDKPVNPDKPVTPDKPDKPVTPEKPEVKLVKSEVETVVENRDYRDFMYVIKEDNTLPKGEERIEKEGVRGYTIYTMKRSKDTYSDGTIKYSDWTIEDKKVVDSINGVKVVGTKEETPDPEKPEVTVVSTEEESKTEDKDYVDFVYDEFEDQNMPKGETKIVEEGKKGYTTYTYTRTKTVYSDGTVKYSDWLEAGKKVVAPVNGTKFIGTYVERKLGWQKEAAIRVGQDIMAFRASLGLTTNIHYDPTYAKMMADNDEFGHYAGVVENEVVAYMPTEFDENGANIVEMWKNSPQHRKQLTYDKDEDCGVDWYIGVYNNGKNIYYSAYSVSIERQETFDKDHKKYTKDTPDFPEEPAPEPEKPVATPTVYKEESNKEEQPSTPAEPVVEEAKPVEELKEEPVKVEETTEKEVEKIKEQPAENKTEENNKVEEAK